MFLASDNIALLEAPSEPAATTRRPSCAGLVGVAATKLLGQGCRLLAPGAKVEGREGAPAGRCQTDAKASPNRRRGDEARAEATASKAVKQSADEELPGAQARQQKIEQELARFEAASIRPHHKTDAGQQTQQE
jgi:hypothetical protein